MTDLELIGLASKASGFVYSKDQNPLECDALALRLAVMVGLTVTIDNSPCAETDAWLYGTIAININESHGQDPFAATRRAIVRAAAEVGKGIAPFPSVDDIREFTGDDAIGAAK